MHLDAQSVKAGERLSDVVLAPKTGDGSGSGVEHRLEVTTHGSRDSDQGGIPVVRVTQYQHCDQRLIDRRQEERRMLSAELASAQTGQHGKQLLIQALHNYINLVNKNDFDKSGIIILIDLSSYFATNQPIYYSISWQRFITIIRCNRPG